MIVVQMNYRFAAHFCSLLMATLDHGAVARRYAERVQAGKILACRWVKAAAQLQLGLTGAIVG
jgi:hypothetical protein